MADQVFNTSTTSEPPGEICTVQSLLRLLRAVRYRKKVMIGVLTVCGLLGGLYYCTAPRVYRSTASLVILQREEAAPSTMVAGRSKLMNTYREMLGSTVVLKDALTYLKPGDRVDLKDVPLAQWVKVLQGNLEVTTARKTNILEVSYRSSDPRAAAAVLGAILTAYSKRVSRLDEETTGKFLDALAKEKRQLEEQLIATGSELLWVCNHAEESEIRDEEQSVNAILKRAGSFNEALIVAHGRRLEAQLQAAAIEAAIKKGEDPYQHALAMVEPADRDALFQRLGINSADARTISQVSQQVFQDKALLFLEQRLPGSVGRKVRKIRLRIQVIEDYLQNQAHVGNSQLREASDEELARALLQTSRQRHEQAVAHENSIRAGYEEQKRAAIAIDRTAAQLEILELDLGRLRKFHDMVAQHLEKAESIQASGLETSILNHPDVPAGAVQPRPYVVVLLSIVIGLVVGLAVVYVQDLRDDRFHSAEELQTESGLPVLAALGRLEPLENNGIEGVHVHMRPNAGKTEVFRSLYAALAMAEDGVRRLVVSSSEPRDGQTTVTVNLAVACAQSGKRTLLIDANMRRPGLTRLLDMQGVHGLSTVLREDGSIAESAKANLRFSGAANLDVLPSGPCPVNRMELLAGDRFSELLSWAEVNYDQILIDSPPATLGDTAIIGRLADGVLLVVQPEKNRRRVVLRAVESFPVLGTKVLGTVVNCPLAEGDGDCYGDSYGYGHGHEEESSDENTDAEDLTRPPSTRIVREAA